MSLFLAAVPMQSPVFAAHGGRWDDAAWVHRRVMNLFPDCDSASPREALGVLYRVERALSTGGRVLVQATVEPMSPDAEVKRLDDLLRALSVGSRVMVRAQLNSAKTVNRTEGGRVLRRRQPIPEKERATWFIGRLPFLSGIDLVRLDHTVLRKGRTPIDTLTGDVIGTVTDPDGLVAALRTGIGKARAYGCGLLSAAPIAN